jgi:hypothetical protein
MNALRGGHNGIRLRQAYGATGFRGHMGLMCRLLARARAPVAPS